MLSAAVLTFAFLAFSLFHRVPSSFAPWRAAANPHESQPTALYNSVFVNRLISILAAGGLEATEALAVKDG